MLHGDTRTRKLDEETRKTGSFPPRSQGLHASPAVEASFSGPALQVSPPEQGHTAWIFDDKEAEKQGIVTQLGGQVQRVFDTFRLANQAVLDETCKLLQHFRPSLIWCSLFRCGAPRGNRRDKQAMRALRRVLLLACTLSCVVVVESSATIPLGSWMRWLS